MYRGESPRLGGPAAAPPSARQKKARPQTFNERSAVSNTFTLDALRNETIRRYSPTEVDLGGGEVVELKSILRLGEKDRKTVIDAIEDINRVEVDDEDDDAVAEWAESVVESCSTIFRVIATSPKKLIARLDHEDPTIKANLFTAVLSRWVGESQLGEAAPSPA